MTKRRTFGNTWWGKQWLNALADVDNENRLSRGRSYYGTGHVQSCEWIAHERRVEAFVTGSAYFPYQINIALPEWSKAQAKSLLDAVAQDPALVAELLEGTLSPTVADICKKLRLELFPASWRSMQTSCTCPDSSRVCKHIAAVFYCLADAIDANPFLIFMLHGLDLQAELKSRGVDLQSAVTAKPLVFSELARAATESLLNPVRLDDESSLAQLRSLPYGTLKSIRETVLALFPESLPTPGDKAFRYSMRQLLSTAERTVSLMPRNASPELWFDRNIASKISGKRLLFDEPTLTSLSLQLVVEATDEARFGAHAVVFVRDDSGKKRRIALKDSASVFAMLLEMPADLARTAPPEIECWREISQLAARLLSKSCIVPALVRAKDKIAGVPLFVWTPAVRDHRTARLVELLTQACAPYADKLFKQCDVPQSDNFTRECVFLALTTAASALMQYAAARCKALADTQSIILLLAMQTPFEDDCTMPPSLLRSMLRGLRAFLLGSSYPWRPVLTVRSHADGIKLNYGILERSVNLSLAEATEMSASDSAHGAASLSQEPSICDKRPVMLARLLREERFRNDRFAAISVLKTLASACPVLAPIESSGGSPITLRRDDLKEFLFKTSPLLTLLGVVVMLPAGLKTLLKPRLVAHADIVKGKSLLGKEALTNFDWKVALGNRELTQEEFEALARHSGEVIQFEENFVYLDPDELARLAETVHDQPQPTYLEKMRAVLMGEFGTGTQTSSILVSQTLHKRIQNLSAVTEITPPDNLHAVLRPYQARGFSWLMKNIRLGIGALLADDMGLGKTLQVIAMLLQLKNDGEFNAQKALVVVPTTLITNWTREIAKFAPSLTVGVYHGQARALPRTIEDLPDVTITSYGLLRREAELLAGYKWRILVLDEAQAVKNIDSGQAVAARAIKAQQTVAMTGTPVENRLSEYWAILDLVQPRLLGSSRDFSRTFTSPIEVDHDASAAEAFRRLTSPFMLRRLKSDKSILADLPDKNSIDQFTTLNPQQAALYQKVLDEHLARLSKLEEQSKETPDNDDYRKNKHALVLGLITSLKQICNSPSQYLKTESPVPDSGKAAALFDILTRCFEANRKVLIFTQYREMGERLQNWIDQVIGQKLDFLHGGVPLKSRQAMVDRFQTDRSVRAMLVSLKAGGTGLNLTAASCVIHYDLWWNPAVEAQATDRVYRIGQRRDVLVYRFVTAGTFEESINKMLEEKRDLADMTVATGETWIGDFSVAELKSFFALNPASVQD